MILCFLGTNNVQVTLMMCVTFDYYFSPLLLAQKRRFSGYSENSRVRNSDIEAETHYFDVGKNDMVTLG